ncbi:hydroxypyruvate isomerase family protein [Amycolatopsis suaedae]|uniref:Hydroxypyruvate isomerase n=1 Tax=Amycolatopsis suaedae TaxID=2510978 RepID=A0A4Q7IZ38_9PSEU|nr:TIM barrel protein [Amycolatopsis suaedae]RZQ59739.1 hydroxypyruvate isomerase [Amycolatopsis suaedae]
MRFDVNLSLVFTELPLLERPAAAKAAGFDAVELWWPFPDAEPANRELDRLADAIRDAGVSLVGLNFDAGDMAEGDRGLLSRPAQSSRFRANIPVAVAFATGLGCTTLNALYGNREPDVFPEQQDELAEENLTLAARAADAAGATVVLEALNAEQNPHYPITTSNQAFTVIDRLKRPNVKFLADFYHLTMMGEDVLALIDRSAHRFGHVQIADVPGRGQPGTGDMPYGDILKRLADSPYDGPVGLEYKPSGPSAQSFEWIKELA